jgi:hypothetical protein
MWRESYTLGRAVGCPETNDTYLIMQLLLTAIVTSSKRAIESLDVSAKCNSSENALTRVVCIKPDVSKNNIGCIFRVDMWED